MVGGVTVGDDWGQDSPTLDPHADAVPHHPVSFLFFLTVGLGEDCCDSMWVIARRATEGTHAISAPPFSSPWNESTDPSLSSVLYTFYHITRISSYYSIFYR